MESLIVKINDLYQKEKQNKIKNENSPNKKGINKNLIEKIYIIEKNDLKEELKMRKINIKDNLPSFQNEKEILSYIEKNDIPIKYISKVIKEILSYKNKDIIIKFIQKNKNKITEKHILLIFIKIKDYNKKIIDDIILCILKNILIDQKYFLELLKEEKIELSKGIILSMNNCLNNLDDIQNKMELLDLIKTLNLISLLKEIIEKDEYDKFEKNIDEIYGKEINKMENKKDLCEEEFNKDFNMEFINSMKIINSNPNKAYYIQENIII